MHINAKREFVVGVAVLVLMTATLAGAVSRSIREVRTAARQEARLAPGKRAPDFELPIAGKAKTGERFVLRGQRGEQLVLYFWIPMRDSRAVDPNVPVIQELGEELARLRARLVVIRPEADYKNAGVKFDGILLTDAKEGKVFRDYRAFPFGLPKLFLVDARGKIRYETNGLKDNTIASVLREVRKLKDRTPGYG